MKEEKKAEDAAAQAATPPQRIFPFNIKQWEKTIADNKVTEIDLSRYVVHDITKMQRDFTIITVNKKITASIILPDGRLLCGYRDGDLSILDPTNKVNAPFVDKNRKPNDSVMALGIMEDKRIVVGYYSGRLSIIDNINKESFYQDFLMDSEKTYLKDFKISEDGFLIIKVCEKNSDYRSTCWCAQVKQKDLQILYYFFIRLEGIRDEDFFERILFLDKNGFGVNATPSRGPSTINIYKINRSSKNIAVDIAKENKVTLVKSGCHQAHTCSNGELVTFGSQCIKFLDRKNQKLLRSIKFYDQFYAAKILEYRNGIFAVFAKPIYDSEDCEIFFIDGQGHTLSRVKLNHKNSEFNWYVGVTGEIIIQYKKYCEIIKPYLKPLALTDLQPLFALLYNNGLLEELYKPNSVRSLSLRHAAINDTDIPSIITLIQRNNSLQQLDLRDTNLTTAGFKKLQAIWQVQHSPENLYWHETLKATILQDHVSTAINYTYFDPDFLSQRAGANPSLFGLDFSHTKKYADVSGHHQMNTIYFSEDKGFLLRGIYMLKDGRFVRYGMIRDNFCIEIWDNTFKNCMFILNKCDCDEDDIFTVVELMDGKLASGHTRGGVLIWDLNSKDNTAKLKAPCGDITNLVVFADGHLATSSLDGIFCILNVDKQNCEALLNIGNSGDILCVQICYGTRYFLVKQASQWLNWTSGAEPNCQVFKFNPEKKLIIIDNNRLCFTSFKNQIFSIFDTDSKEIGTISVPDVKTYKDFICLKGTHILTTHYEQDTLILKLWEGGVNSKFSCVHTTRHPHFNYDKYVVLHDGRIVFLEQKGQKIYIYNPGLCFLALKDLDRLFSVIVNQIRYLSLQNMQLSDDDVPDLILRLKSYQKLERVDLRNTKITTEGISKIQAANILNNRQLEILFTPAASSENDFSAANPVLHTPIASQVLVPILCQKEEKQKPQEFPRIQQQQTVFIARAETVSLDIQKQSAKFSPQPTEQKTPALISTEKFVQPAPAKAATPVARATINMPVRSKGLFDDDSENDLFSSKPKAEVISAKATAALSNQQAAVSAKQIEQKTPIPAKTPDAVKPALAVVGTSQPTLAKPPKSMESLFDEGEDDFLFEKSKALLVAKLKSSLFEEVVNAQPKLQTATVLPMPIVPPSTIAQPKTSAVAQLRAQPEEQKTPLVSQEQQAPQPIIVAQSPTLSAVVTPKPEENPLAGNNISPEDLVVICADVAKANEEVKAVQQQLRSIDGNSLAVIQGHGQALENLIAAEPFITKMIGDYEHLQKLLSQQKQTEAIEQAFGQHVCLQEYQQVFSRLLSSIWIACASIASQMVKNDKKTWAESISAAFNEIGKHIPGVSIVTDILSKIISALDGVEKECAVNRMVQFLNDLPNAAKLIDAISKQLALAKKPELDKLLQAKPATWEKMKLFVNYAKDKLLKDGINNAVKAKAAEDTEQLIGAVMNEAIKIPAELDNVLKFFMGSRFELVAEEKEREIPRLVSVSTQLVVVVPPPQLSLHIKQQGVAPLAVAIPQPAEESKIDQLFKLFHSQQKEQIVLREMLQASEAAQQQLLEELRLVKEERAKQEEQNKLAVMESIKTQMAALKGKVDAIKQDEAKSEHLNKLHQEAGDVLAKLNALGLSDLPPIEEIDKGGQVVAQLSESASNDPKSHFVRMHKQMHFYREQYGLLVAELVPLKEAVEKVQEQLDSFQLYSGKSFRMK